MKYVFENLQEVIDHLEDKKQEKRDLIGKTRTKIESNEAKGYVQGLDEAVYFLRQYQKQQETSTGNTSFESPELFSESPTEVGPDYGMQVAEESVIVSKTRK